MKYYSKFYCWLFYSSDYGTLSPQSPQNEGGLSPVEKMIYSTIMQQGNKPTRSCSPCDSDTSGISSEGSEAALIDMMVSGSL